MAGHMTGLVAALEVHSVTAREGPKISTRFRGRVGICRRQRKVPMAGHLQDPDGFEEEQGVTKGIDHDRNPKVQSQPTSLAHDIEFGFR